MKQSHEYSENNVTEREPIRRDKFDQTIIPGQESSEKVSMPIATTTRIFLVGFVLSMAAGYNMGNLFFISYGINVRFIIKTFYNFHIALYIC